MADKKWELGDNPIMASDPETLFFPLMELSLNKHIFHIDVLPKGDDVVIHRYITADLHHALAFIKNDGIEKFHIALQSRRCDNEDGDYAISTIIEIQESIDVDINNQKTIIFVCANGKRYFDWLHTSEDVPTLDNLVVIYKDDQLL